MYNRVDPYERVVGESALLWLMSLSANKRAVWVVKVTLDCLFPYKHVERRGRESMQVQVQCSAAMRCALWMWNKSGRDAMHRSACRRKEAIREG